MCKRFDNHNQFHFILLIQILIISPNSIFCLFVFYVDTFLLFSSSYTRSVLQRMSGRTVFNYNICTVIHYTYDSISCSSKFNIFLDCLLVGFISSLSYTTWRFYVFIHHWLLNDYVRDFLLKVIKENDSAISNLLNIFLSAVGIFKIIDLKLIQNICKISYPVLLLRYNFTCFSRPIPKQDFVNLYIYKTDCRQFTNNFYMLSLSKIICMFCNVCFKWRESNVEYGCVSLI